MKIQGEKLRAMVSHAFHNTAFYRRLYGAVCPEVKSPRDIKRLPIITKEELRRTPLEERTAAGTDLSRCVRKTTSGTTGVPVTILEDTRSAAYLEGVYLRRLWSYGVRPWHRIFRIVAGPVEKVYEQNIADIAGFWGRIRTSRVARLSSAEDIHAHLRIFIEKGASVLVAPPSYFRALREVCESFEKRLGLEVAVTWGELLDLKTRRMISDFFGAEVFDGYGCTEVAPIGGLAWECPTHTAYHINIDSVVLEFLKDGEEVAGGEPGEVVATSLFRWATPIIRYYLGDKATPIDDECPCGRGLPLLKNIEGRIVDSIKKPDGGYISPYTIMFTLQYVEGLRQFRVIQKSDYSVEVQVRVEGDAEKVLREIDLRCRALFDSIVYDVKVLDAFEHERGKKFKMVESHAT
ncbi:MAG: AMP-binding protein [Nitrososphaerota archaeon]|nr:AMP-binding protein [Nitrososphaerota archaeon]